MYISQLINSSRFILISLLNLVNYFSEGKIKCKFKHKDKKFKTCRTKCKYCRYFLKQTNFKDDLVEYKWFML